MNKVKLLWKAGAILVVGFMTLGCWSGCSIQYSSSSDSKTFQFGSNERKGPARLVLKAGEDSGQGEWETDLENSSDREKDGSTAVMIEFHQKRSVHSFGHRKIPNFPRAKKEAAGPVPVTFMMDTEAGTLNFSGTVEGDEASGKYAFAPNAEYQKGAGELLQRELANQDLVELGFAEVSLDYIRGVQSTGLKAGYEDVLTLRRHGLKVETVKDYAALGYNTAELVKLRNHGVTPEFAREVTNLGYGKKVDELTRLRNYGVTSNYIKEWRSAGFEWSTEEIIKLKNHGIQPEYGAAWKKAGHELKQEELIKLKNHGLSAEYASAWSDAGYKLSYDEMIKARNHGVPREFALALKEGGYSPALDEIIRLRQYGVTPEYYLAMKKNQSSYSTEEMLKFRQHGVTPEFVKGLQEAGYEFSSEQIIKLRNNGVAVDYVAALDVPGRSKLDVETIIDLRRRGVSAETARKLRE